MFPAVAAGIWIDFARGKPNGILVYLFAIPLDRYEFFAAFATIPGPVFNVSGLFLRAVVKTFQSSMFKVFPVIASAVTGDIFIFGNVVRATSVLGNIGALFTEVMRPRNVDIPDNLFFYLVQLLLRFVEVSNRGFHGGRHRNSRDTGITRGSRHFRCHQFVGFPSNGVVLTQIVGILSDELVS